MRSTIGITAILIAVTMTALAAGNGAAPAAGWLCAAGTGTGYWYDPAGRRWETLVFAAEGQSFHLRPAGPGREGVRWELVRLAVSPGSGDAVLACTGDFAADGSLACGAGDVFRFNRQTLIFASHLDVTGPGVPEDLSAGTVTGRCHAAYTTP